MVFKAHFLTRVSYSLLGVMFWVCISPMCIAQPQTFAQAVNQLKVQHKPIVLQQGETRAVVLAEFQGRVMVTSAEGEQGAVLGWANFDYLQQPNTDNNSATGGASRLWFGPETGPYSVFFKPGKSRTVENIQVQDAVSLQPFTLISQSNSVANFKQNISIQNHLGFIFDLRVERKIELFTRSSIAKNLSIEIDKELSVVGFGAQTQITNNSQTDWRKETGLLSIWELGAFAPSDDTVIFMPISGDLPEVTSYFNPTKASHTQIKNAVVYYKADANYMNKIGIPAKNAQALIGSYDPTAKLLTVFQYQLNPADELYNNSVWFEENYQPYNGDVINVFNDGLGDGEGPFGPFYELETSSSARELKVGQSQQHFQNTFHFQGDEKQLNVITEQLFGLSLDTVLTVFRE